MSWKLRMAKKSDVEAILVLINEESTRSNVVPRNFIDWQNFVVAEIKGELVACVGYKTWDQILPEIISTIVRPEYRGKTDIGYSMVYKLLAQLQRRGFRSVFCLTDRGDFFSRIGFAEADVGLFPAKIMSDCSRCPKNYGSPLNPLCHERAMFTRL
jgi:argininosuccinate lyase/amino-acid N-acetyltransferase